MRIEDLGVYAVDDSEQLVGAGVEYTFEAFAVIRGLYLLGIGGTDRIQCIGKYAACLEKVCASVELHKLGSIILFVYF